MLERAEMALGLVRRGEVSGEKVVFKLDA